MSRQLKTLKNFFRHDGAFLTPEKRKTLREAADPREKEVLRLAFAEGYTAVEMVKQGLIKSKTGKNHPITARSITRLMANLSERTGIKVRINDLNLCYNIRVKYRILYERGYLKNLNIAKFM